MKKLTKLLFAVLTICTMFSAMSFSIYAISMPEVQVLSFAVSGAETYPDGSALAKDECYAFVWSKDGNFDGLNPDGTPIHEGDEVLYIGKIYKDSNVVFRLEDGFKSGGTFEVFILDTRVFENDKLQSVGKTKGIVNVRDYVKAANAKVMSSGSQAIPTAMLTPIEGLPNGVVIAQPTIDPANIPAFRFTSIYVDGNWVVTIIDNTIPGVNNATVSGTEGKPIVLIRPKTADSAIIRGSVKTVFSTGDLRIIITIAAVFAVSVLVLAFKRKKRCPSSYFDEQKQER